MNDQNNPTDPMNPGVSTPPMGGVVDPMGQPAPTGTPEPAQPAQEPSVPPVPGVSEQPATPPAPAADQPVDPMVPPAGDTGQNPPQAA